MLYPHIDIAERALNAGCRVLQLRDKRNSSLEFYQTAVRIRKLMNDKSDMFIVNDRADIALAVNADALHLGEEDLPIEYARKICGNSMIIGLSTHNLEQAIQAEKAGADYIGLGPCFHTDTKKLKYKPIDLDVIRDVKKHVKIPIVAIGGIKKDNIKSVIEAGADVAAVSSAICHAKDIENEINLFFKEIEGI